MGVIPSLGARENRVGNDAGWAVMLFKENEDGTGLDDPMTTFRVEDYNATIDATLPAGLNGGAVTVEIEGISEADYRKLKSANVMHLILYWRDVRDSLGAAVGAALGGLVGANDAIAKLSDAELAERRVVELSITDVSRKAGERRYVTKITAVNRAYNHLARARVGADITLPRLVEVALTGLADALNAAAGAISNALGGDAPSAPGAGAAQQPPEEQPLLTDALESIFARAQVEYETIGLESLEGADPPVRLETQTGQSGTEVVTEALKVLVRRLGKAGRPLVLFRDRSVIVGPRNPFMPEGDGGGGGGLPGAGDIADALPGGDSDPALPLTEATGLLEVLAQPPLVDDQGNERRCFALTLKGSAQILPGDLVKFPTPPVEDLSEPNVGALVGDAIAGSVLGGVLPSLDGNIDPATNLYVNIVRHRLSRTGGFTTVLSGVEVTGADDVFDTPPRDRSDRAPGGAEATGGQGADRAQDATRGVARLIQRTIDARRLPEVAEVRRFTNTPGNTPSDGVAQTSRVWHGLVPSEPTDLIQARRYRAADIEIQPPSVSEHVSYLTPFAWQDFGLILPRYPGTRVMLGHRAGDADEMFDMGALFTGQGPESQPGDWWLRLPIGVSEDLRAGVDGATDAPVPHSGPASHDLIDAEGNRVIEHGALTIRIGTTGEATERPGVAEEGGISIEHTGGAKLVMRSDGTLEIEARSLELKSTEGGDARIALAGGDITMEAGTIDIAVSNRVDIHG